MTELEKFTTRVECGAEVVFHLDHDLVTDIDKRLGHGDGGYLLVRLNIDGENYDEVHICPPIGSANNGRTAPVILREVVGKLEQLADTHDALEGVLHA